jgi:hypothetical protein
MKVYLDDERAAPPGWVRAYWPSEVIALLETGQVEELSLDHDLGDDARGTGYDVVLWIEEAVAMRSFRPPKMSVHSANSSAGDKMRAGIAAIERLAAADAARVRRVYLDTEFTTIDPVEEAELISVGLVADDGSEIYVERLDDQLRARCSEFVRREVLPQFGQVRGAQAASYPELADRLAGFLMGLGGQSAALLRLQDRPRARCTCARAREGLARAGAAADVAQRGHRVLDQRGPERYCGLLERSTGLVAPETAPRAC